MKEVIINGVTVDLDENTKLDLQYVSFLFAGISSLSSPRSWTVSLPKTAINEGLINGASNSDYDGNFPYDNFTIDYYNRGIRIINTGKAILTKIGDRIEFIFTFGAVFDKIKLMSETKLTELPYVADDILVWNSSMNLNDMSYGAGWCDWYSFTNEDRSYIPGIGHADIPYAVLHPTVTFNYIMNKIQTLFAISLVGISSTFLNSCSFPLKEINDETEPIKFSFTQYAKFVDFDSSKHLRFSPIDSNILIENYNVVAGKFYNFKALKTNTYEFEFSIVTVGNTDVDTWVVLHWTNELGVAKTQRANRTIRGANYMHYFDMGFTAKAGTLFYLQMEVTAVPYTAYSGYEYYLGSYDNGSNPPNQPKFTVSIGEIAYNSNFPIIPNLPDMTCADFLFQAMQLQGVFPSIDDSDPNTINFYSADLLYDNISTAKDWSSKLVKSTNKMGELSDVEFKFGSYAQKNTLAYKTDETNLLATDSYLTVSNKNLEDETKLVDLKFAAGKRFSKTDTIIDYPLYDIKIQDGVLVKNAKNQSNDVIANIINVDNINYLKFTDDLLWSNIKATDNYVAYQKLIDKPRYLKEKFYLKPEDMQNFKSEIPIYLQQYGKYYAVMKLQYRDNDFSECELLEIKNI